MRKKLVFFLLLLITFSSVNGFSAWSPYLLRVATVKEAGSSEAEALYQFKSLVENATSGRVSVKVYTDGVLGTEEDLVEGVQKGTMEAFITASFKYSSFVPELELLEIPFLFSGEKHWRQVFQGSIGKRLESYPFQRRGDMVLGYMTGGPSNLLSSQPMIGLFALQRKKVRVMTYPLIVSAWKNLGIEPLAVARDDLSAALQTGLVDAAESTFLLIKKMRYYEPPYKYVLRTQHRIDTSLFLLGRLAYEQLPADLRRIVMDCGQKAAQWQVEKSLQENKRAEEELTTRHWVKVTELGPEERRLWVEKVQPLQDRIATRSGMTEILKEIRAATPPEESVEEVQRGKAIIESKDHSPPSSEREDGSRPADPVQ